MTDLSLFEEEKSSDESLFTSRPSSVVPLSKEDDSKNIAAQLAIAEPKGNLVRTYQDLSALEGSDLLSQSDALATKKMVEDKEGINDVLADMSVSGEFDGEELLNIINAAPEAISQKKDSMQRMAEAMNVESSHDETEAEWEDLLDTSSILSPIVELQKEKQKSFNLLRVGNDGKEVKITNNLLDLFEALVPFAEQTFLTKARLALQNGDVSALREALFFALQGEGKMFLKDKWDTSTMDQKTLLARALPAALQDVRGLVFTNDNDLLQLDTFMTATDTSYYGNLDRMVDNVVSLLDTTLIGSPVAKGISLLARASRTSKMNKRTYRSSKQPASPRAVAEQVNGNKATELHTMEMADQSDETAKVVSGTTRSEAAVDAVAPQVRVEGGSVEAVPYALDADISKAMSTELSSVERSIGELEETASKIDKDLQAVQGLTTNTQLSTAPEVLDSGKIQINQTFTRGKTGFTNPQQAVNETIRKLSHYGIDESNITLLRKSGDEYVETTLKEAMAKDEIRAEFIKKKKKLPDEFKKVNMRDNYAVRVNLDYEPTALDIVREELDVSRNFFDRLPFGVGKGSATISRWFLPPQAMLDPRITAGASAAVDQSNRLHKLLAEKADEALTSFRNLSKNDQEIVDNLLVQQVLQKRYFTKGELLEEGISKEAANTLDLWKRNNDQYYHLTNADMVNHYRNRGFSIFLDKTSKESFLVKPVSKSDAALVGKVYDPATKSFKTLDERELKELYAGGGVVSKLRKSEEIEGLEVTHIMSIGSDANRVVRGLKEGDKILNYKPGHSFTVRYKDPYFLESFKRDAKGKIIEDSVRAVFTSPNKKDALAAVERLNKKSAGSGVEYRHRNNKDLNIDETIDARFDLAEATGMTAQRKRGETVPQYSRSDDADLQYSIQSPIESMKTTMRELSNRMPMRKYLDDLEARWMAQYGKVANTEKNIFGRQAMPRSTDEFKSLDAKDLDMTPKQYADAKTTLEFYNMMKYGYHNALDKNWRKSFNWLGDFVGSKSTWAEGFFRGVSEEIASPVGSLRSLAFNQWIAASMPSSQWLVQGVPALANSFLHPTYVFNPKGLVYDMSLLTLGITSKKGPADKMLKKAMPEGKYAEMKQLVKDWDRTGLGAGIDKHLIVENGLDHLIESQRFAMGKAAYNEVFDRLRQAGFDAGEFVNLASYWLGTRNDFIKNGKSMANARTVDEVRTKTRNLTLNMNKAGEMPWNKNSLSLITQFLISPYQGMTVFLNKGLSPKERTSLALWNLGMMPMPAYFSYQLRSNFDLNENQSEVVSNGIAGGMLNIAFKAMIDEETSIDFTRLNQFDPTMPWELVHGLMTEPVGAMMSASASLSSLFGHNPVLARLAENTYKYISSPFKDLSEQEQAEIEGALVSSFANTTALGRSLSTAWKELYLQEYTNRYNSLGFVVKEEVTTPESLAKVFGGLRTSLEAQVMQVNRDLYYKSEDAKKDMLAFFTNVQRTATESGYNIDDPGREEYMNRMFLAAFPEGELPEQLMKMWDGLLRASYKKGDAPIINQITKAAGWLGTEEAVDFARSLKEVSPEAAEAFDWARSEQALKDMREFVDE